MSEFTPSFQKRLEDLQRVVFSAEDELKKLRLVYSKFPEVLFNVDRKIYYTSDANPVVTDVEFTFGYNSVYALFYLTVNNVRVYADPPSLIIGFENHGEMGYFFYDHTEKFLVEAKVPAAVIEKVTAFRKTHSVPITDESRYIDERMIYAESNGKE